MAKKKKQDETAEPLEPMVSFKVSGSAPVRVVHGNVFDVSYEPDVIHTETVSVWEDHLKRLTANGKPLFIAEAEP